MVTKAAVVEPLMVTEPVVVTELLVPGVTSPLTVVGAVSVPVRLIAAFEQSAAPVLSVWAE